MIYTVTNLNTGKKRFFFVRRSAARYIIKMFDKHEEFSVWKDGSAVFEKFEYTDYLATYNEEETNKLTEIMHGMLSRRRMKEGLTT